MPHLRILLSSPSCIMYSDDLDFQYSFSILVVSTPYIIYMCPNLASACEPQSVCDHDLVLLLSHSKIAETFWDWPSLYPHALLKLPTIIQWRQLTLSKQSWNRTWKFRQTCSVSLYTASRGLTRPSVLLVAHTCGNLSFNSDQTVVKGTFPERLQHILSGPGSGSMKVECVVFPAYEVSHG